MRVLIVGAGVIGTVYGAHLGAAGHAVSVLRHPPRTGDVAARGLAARDALTGRRAETRVQVVPDAAGSYDLVMAAVRSDQLAPACAQLTALAGAPAVLFFGNNPGGRSGIPANVPGEIRLGFPGVGGVMRDGVAEYVRIKQRTRPRPATCSSSCRRRPATPSQQRPPPPTVPIPGHPLRDASRGIGSGIGDHDRANGACRAGNGRGSSVGQVAV